jgi:hypothetical protein
MFQTVYNYLSIPGSEVDIERLFNTECDMLSIQRFSISNNILQIMIILKNILRVQTELKDSKNR